jgi:hypothetical protein
MSTYIGCPVLILVPPASNDGVDELPATVVAIRGDAVDVVDVNGVRRTGLNLFEDRAAADASLDEDRALLPGENRPRSDVYQWSTAAFYGELASRTTPAPAPAVPAATEPES